MRVLAVLVGLLVASTSPGEPPAKLFSPEPLHILPQVGPKKFSYLEVTFSPDGKTILFGGGSGFGPGTLVFWDVATGKIRHSHSHHKLAIHSVAVSPDGKLVATGGGAGEIILWNAEGEVLKRLEADDAYTESIRFSPDGRLMAHCGGKLFVRETGRFEIVAEPGKPDMFGMLGAFSPDGKTLMGSSARGSIKFMDVSDWKIRTHRTKIANQGYYSPFYSPDGKSVVVGTLFYKEEDGERTPVFSTEVWAATREGVGEKRFEVPGHHIGQTISPDGKYLFVGEAEPEDRNRIRVWSMASGKEVVSWPIDSLGGASIRSLAVSPDGKLLASCDDGQQGKIWDLEAILKGR